MATAGVSIASAVVEEEGTSEAVETVVDIFPQPIVDVADRQYAAAAVARMPHRRAVAPLTAVADRMAADRTVAANATSR